jgi:hypothetical protein
VHFFGVGVTFGPLVTDPDDRQVPVILLIFCHENFKSADDMEHKNLTLLIFIGLV